LHLNRDLEQLTLLCYRLANVHMENQKLDGQLKKKMDLGTWVLKMRSWYK